MSLLGRRITWGYVVGVLLLVSTGVRSEESQGVYIDRDRVRAGLIELYNSVSSVSAVEYEKMILQFAENFRNEANKVGESKAMELLARADTLEVMADPQFKPELLAMLKTKIEDQSQNGLFCALLPCYQEIIIVILLNIFTLDGEEVANY